MIDQNGCYLWLGTKTRTGYSLSFWNGKQRMVHRIMYYLHTQVWSTRSRPLDHLCRVRHCVNPEHLELVTPKINAERGVYINPKKYWTHCINGHEFTPENTARYGNQGRKCLACKKVRDKTYRLKNIKKIAQYKREWNAKRKSQNV